MKLSTCLLIVCAALLAALGVVMVFSASYYNHPWTSMERQLLAGVLGVVVGVVAAKLPHRWLKPASPYVYAAAVLLLVLVLIPYVGHSSHGARRWFRFHFGGLAFQPSDLAKPALLLFLAYYGAVNQRLMDRFKFGVIGPVLILGGVMIPIFLEPDWGTSLLLGGVGVVVMLVAGTRWYYVLPGLILGGALVAGMLYHNPMRSARIYSWLHLKETRANIGNQAWEARLALGSGGMEGKGLNRSTQLRFISESRNDFIFAIIGEEFGFRGSVVLIGLFMAVFLCGIRIAWQAADRFGLLLATGITFLIGFQALLNLGVVSGALPNKGIALPFISYGGSSLMMMMISTGLLLGVAFQDKTERIGSGETEVEDLGAGQLA